MQLTTKDLETLRKHFALRDHEFLRDFAYITEGAITTRIEDVDPEWTFEVLHITTRDTQVVVHARMMIKGVARDGVGMAVIQSAGEAEKSAATDALKRCARLFGIGRYLLDLPKEVKDLRTLEAWFNRQAPSNVQQMPTTQEARAALGTPSGQRVGADDILPTAPVTQAANVTKVTVKRTGQGEGKILTLALDNKLYLKLRTRKLFIDAGWVGGDEWTADGDYVLETPIPITIKRDETGKGWDIAGVGQAPSAFLKAS